MTNLSNMLSFLDEEIRGLQARISTYGNAAQHEKLAMLKNIRDQIAALNNRRASA